MTSIENDTLFDLTPYGGVETPREKRKAKRQATPEPSRYGPVEVLTNGWRLIRGLHGVLPGAHLVKVTSTEGGVLTLCNQWGTTLPRFDDDAARRCPMCDMEAQL